MLVVAYVDGACSGNPGPMGVGVILHVIGKGEILKEVKLSVPLTEGTNNQAEFLAVKQAMLEILEDKRKLVSLVVFSDSQVAVNGLTGNWKISNPELKKIEFDILILMKQFKNVMLYQATAEMISEVDGLAKAAAGGESRRITSTTTRK